MNTDTNHRLVKRPAQDERAISVLAVKAGACPTCKARRGRPCVAVTGQQLTYSAWYTHKARRADLDEIYMLGVARGMGGA